MLNRIAIIFSRRKINIESLNTSPTEVDSVHRFTIVINEIEEVVKKLCRQIEKQVEVLKAYYNTEEEIVWQELALYKVSTDAIAEKVKVERLLREYGARAVEEIEEVSKQLAQLVANIFDITHTQTQTANTVVANMEEILHITRQNTQGTLQTTASIRQITGFASELKASVSNFKV